MGWQELQPRIFCGRSGNSFFLRYSEGEVFSMAALGTVPHPSPVRRTCHILKSSAGGQQVLHRSQSFSNALYVESHGVPKRLSSSSVLRQRDWRNELLLPPCQQSCYSAQLTKSATAGQGLHCKDSAGSDSSISHSGVTENSNFDIYATALGGLGLLACSLQFPEASLAAATTATEASFPTVMTFAGAEPSNALSLPTWVIHVASVVEWVTAMALVWKYGDADGKSSWKGLTWGMVPLLGGAMCACTWHFFYNAESLEVLVVLQAFLTVVGNFTMWAAAYRIWRLSQDKVTAD